MTTLQARKLVLVFNFAAAHNCGPKGCISVAGEELVFYNLRFVLMVSFFYYLHTMAEMKTKDIKRNERKLYENHTKQEPGRQKQELMKEMERFFF